MAQELDEDKQVDMPNPDNPEWYDQTLKDIQSLPETDEPTLSEPDGGQTLAERELNASPSDGNDAPTSVAESGLQNQDRVGRGYKPSKRKVSLRDRLKSRKVIAGGAAGSLIATGAIALVFAFPGILANQIREILTSKVGDLQTRQQLKYRRTKLARISDVFSKDGRMGSKIIAEMEADGYKFSFDPNDRNTIRGITLPDGKTSLPNTSAMGQHISDYMEVKHPLRTSKWKTKRMEAFYSRYKVSRVSVIRPSPNDLEDPSKTINRNLATVVDGEELDVRTRAPDVGEDATDEDRLRASETEDFGKNNGAFDELNERVKATGENIEDINPETAQIAKTIGDAIDPDLHQTVNAIAGTGSVGGKILSGVKSLGVTDLADKVCTIKNRLRAAVTAARTVKALSMMRYAAAFIGASDGTRKGDASSGLLSALMKRTTATDANGNSIGASPGFAYALKGYFSKSRNNDTRSTIAVDGKPTGVVATIQNTTDGFPGTSEGQCNVWQNPAVQIGAGIIEIGISFFSGGTSTAGTTAAKEGVKVAVKEAIKKAINRSVVRSLAKSIAFSAAVELSFEGIMTLTQLYAEKQLTYAFTGQETGGQLGDILIGGAGTMSKQRSLQAGFVPATTQQYAAAHNEYMQTIAQEKKEQSVFARFFDIQNVDSLASTAFWSAPKNKQELGSIAQRGIGSLAASPATLVASLTNTLTPKTFAQDPDIVAYDTYVTEGNNSGVELATDPAGNLLPIMREDIAAIDPADNETYLTTRGYMDPVTKEPLGEFVEYIENCVNNVDTISIIEATGPGDLAPGNDCLAKLEPTTHFAARLAVADVEDSVEAEFDPSSLTSGGSSSGPTTSGPIDCSAAVGNQKIICAAEGYRGIRYSNGSSKWATTWGVSSTDGRLNGGDNAEAWLARRVPNGTADFIDCSGYANLSMFVAFGHKTTAGCSGYYVRDTNNDGFSDADRNLKIIPIDQVQPGDFVTVSQVCNTPGASGHIGIFVEKLPNGNWSTLESSAGKSPETGESRSGYYERSPTYFKYAARYVGTGGATP